METGKLRVLILIAGQRRCALRLRSVVETMRPQPLNRIPGQPEFVLGVSIIRGESVPVVDLPVLLAVAPAAPRTRFVVIATGDGRKVALAVDSVEDVRSLPGEAFGALPPILGPEARGIVPEIAALDHDLLLVLEASRLLPDSLIESRGVEPAS